MHFKCFNGKCQIRQIKTLTVQVDFCRIIVSEQRELYFVRV